MTLQANPQTKNGVWGFMITAWEEGVSSPVFEHWLSSEETRRLVGQMGAKIIEPASGPPNGKENGGTDG